MSQWARMLLCSLYLLLIDDCFFYSTTKIGKVANATRLLDGYVPVQLSCRPQKLGRPSKQPCRRLFWLQMPNRWPLPASKQIGM